MNLGHILPLVLQLDGRETNLYVQAKVYDATGSQISGSPFTLAHVAGGLYQNSTAAMPNSDFVSAQYNAYTDAGFTTLSDYPAALDSWELTESSGGGGSSIISPEVIVLVNDSTLSLTCAVEDQNEIICSLEDC